MCELSDDRGSLQERRRIFRGRDETASFIGQPTVTKAPSSPYWIGGYTLKSPSGTVLASHATAKSFTYTVTSPVLASWDFTWQYRHDFSTTEHGTIAYGDEMGLSAKSGWIARGTSVTLTAEPAAGYAFAGWSGDTDGLDASAAALVFVADRPRNLVAHFKVKYDWSATSYVRNGLVVQYDGLDNAGFCTNDATATTWRNLSVNGRDAMKNGDYAMPVWESDGIVWTNASVAASLYIPGSDALESVGTNDFTVEISATAAMPSSMNTGLLALWPMYTGGYQSAFTMRAGYSKIYVGYKTGQFSCVEGSSIKNSRFNMTFVRKQKDAQFTVYYDGAKYGDYSAAEGYCSVNWATLGRSASDAMLAGFKGNVHAVRIYSRALTAAEVERNNLVDRARFWGTGERSISMRARTARVSSCAVPACGCWERDATGRSSRCPRERRLPSSEVSPKSPTSRSSAPHAACGWRTPAALRRRTLKKTSPAGNFGRRAWTGERYRHDLDGRLKPTGQLDAGCYFADKWGRMLIVR